MMQIVIKIFLIVDFICFIIIAYFLGMEKGFKKGFESGARNMLAYALEDLKFIKNSVDRIRNDNMNSLLDKVINYDKGEVTIIQYDKK